MQRGDRFAWLSAGLCLLGVTGDFVWSAVGVARNERGFAQIFPGAETPPDRACFVVGDEGFDFAYEAEWRDQEGATRALRELAERGRVACDSRGERSHVWHRPVEWGGPACEPSVVCEFSVPHGMGTLVRSCEGLHLSGSFDSSREDFPFGGLGALVSGPGSCSERARVERGPGGERSAP